MHARTHARTHIHIENRTLLLSKWLLNETIARYMQRYVPGGFGALVLHSV